MFNPGENTWMKTGIEFFGGKPFVGSVATAQWSDWALVPLEKEKAGRVTIQVERHMKEGKKQDSLWIYVVDEVTKEKVAVRQITWWFTHDTQDEKKKKKKTSTDDYDDDDRCLLIGIYAARPIVPAGEERKEEELAVNLEGFEVKLFDDC